MALSKELIEALKSLPQKKKLELLIKLKKQLKEEEQIEINNKKGKCEHGYTVCFYCEQGS